MRTKTIFCCLVLLSMVSNTVSSQKLFSLEDIMSGGRNYSKLQIKTPRIYWDGAELKEKKGSGAGLRSTSLYADLRDNQLFVTDSEGVTTQVTTDGSRNIVYGKAVHRNEFGIEDGLFWSPDKSRLAFYRMDQSMVTDYPQIDISTLCASYAPDKYPMAGETSHEVTVGVFDLKTRKTIYLKAGNPKNRYFTNISWSTDSKKIYLFELNRDQTDASLDCYDAVTGDKLATLYKEHDDKYTEPSHPIMFLPWDETQFIMQSQKDGYNKIYLCQLQEMSISSIKVFDKGHVDYVITDVYGFNSGTKTIFVQAVKSDERDYNIFGINLSNGKWTMLSNGKGVHTAILNDNGTKLADSYSDPATPRQIDIVETSNGKHTPYYTAKNTWEGYDVPQFKTGTVKAADGKTDLFYRMVLPYNFDPNKKYPTIVYVYGGPHAHNVQNSWNYGYRPWEVYMSQKGYILFILDNRGSEDRGKEFEQVTYRQLGQEEMKDQMKGVEYLKTLPYVDANRLGVHGWSFGGFMTISLMLNYPDVFKVAVAGGPVIDWKYYEVMYGERYMDTPQDNPEGYEKTSLLNKADKLNGKLLIIHGGNDKTVVPQQSLQFLKAAIDADKQLDFFMYPEEEHNMAKHRRIHLHEKITQYFLDYLK